MNISEVCIRRPVFTWVLVAVPVVLGIVSYFRLGVDLFPKVDFPFVSVQAELAGASAEEMESTVTKLIEESLNTISGVNELRSTTREGMSQVVIEFSLQKDGDIAVQEVRDKISMLVRQFPNGMEMPLVNKFDLDAAPIMTICVSGRRDVREITEIAKHKIQENLQTVNGVGAVFMTGSRTRAINVFLDADQLASYSLTVEDVRRALMTQNIETPGGIVAQGPRELVLRTLGRIPTVEKFRDIVISTRSEYPIRIRDVAQVVDSVEEPRGLSRLDDQTAVSLFVQKQSGTNTVAVSDLVQERLKEIHKLLPSDMKIEITQDQSRFIRKSMEELRFHLLLAAVLVSLTILLFIRDWRTTVIATMAIPTSIVPTFLFMWWMGFTLNNITMLGLILAIGIVIDDAVVVHENIFRHMEEYGSDAIKAARDGTREISLAVLATSLSLLVIFLPIAFMGGIVGRFFSSFGLTVAFSIAMSLFVSFTLTPMLCSRFLKLDASHAGQAKSKSGWIYRSVDIGYGWALRWALHRRWIMVIICILVVLSTGPIASKMGANLVPRDDQSEFQVTFITPEGYTLERTNQVVSEIEKRLTKIPTVVHHYTVIGQSTGKGVGDVTRGSIYCRMKELDERKVSQFDVMNEARAVLLDYPDVRTAVTDVSAIQANGQDTRLFQMTIQGPELEKLAEYSQELRDRLRKLKGLTDVDSTLSLRKPEVQVNIDRDRAADLKVSVDTIASTLNVLIAGQPVTRYKDGTEQYDVWLRAAEKFRRNPDELGTLMVPTGTPGVLTQLNTLASWEEARGPSQIDRLNRQRTVTILGNPDGVSLNEAVQEARKIAEEMKLPPEYSINFVGQAKTLGETGKYFMIALGLSVLFMYLILAAQFESWLHPISILTALPITIPFGLLSLLLFRQPIDLYAMFGLFMLIGIVKKNGILQVDKTNELSRGGMEREAAILEANHVRLRPILMTTVMLIAAMFPIALGQGPGSGARASMAKIIIGGQALSLLLALLVTPVTYSLFDDLSLLIKRFTGEPKKAD